MYKRQGLLTSEWETGGSKPRKYYRVTPEGREVCARLKAAWQALSLIHIYQDDFDADNVGLLEVDFFTKEEYCALGLDLGVDWPEDQGLNVCAGSPLEGEVRVIGGYPYLYEAQVPPLDEAEVQAFLQARGGDWAAFRERFGAPCAGGGRAFYDLPQEGGEPRWLSLLLDGDEILSARVVDRCV